MAFKYARTVSLSIELTSAIKTEAEFSQKIVAQRKENSPPLTQLLHLGCPVRLPVTVMHTFATYETVAWIGSDDPIMLMHTTFTFND